MIALKKIVAFWCVVVCFISGYCCGVSAGERFCAVEKLSIETQYLKYGTYAELSGDNAVPLKQLHWTIQCKSMKTHRQILFFINKETQFCSLDLPLTEGMPIRLLDDKKRLVEQSFPSFLPPSNYPAPCRILDFDGIWGSDTFEVAKNAGGRKFKRRYKIVEREVDFKTAQDSQWIRSQGQVNETDPLILYTVFDRKDKFMFRQLWKKGDSWWVYEETPNSKSWRE